MNLSYLTSIHHAPILMRSIARVAALALCLSGGAHAASTDTPGQVVYVDDGDTLVVMRGNHARFNVRLASIDAPETGHTSHERGRLGQPFGDNARRYLDALVKGRMVIARCYEADRYSRQVCDILVNGESANRAMVAAGLAWANTAAHGRYLRDTAMLTLQADAQRRRMGLWSDANPVAPWEWRTSCWKSDECPRR
jgi:micrococcal nuclease